MDWKCQLKLSIMIGFIAAVVTHSFMHHMVGLSTDIWFNSVIFAGAAIAFMVGLRLGWINCQLTKCPTNEEEAPDIK